MNSIGFKLIVISGITAVLIIGIFAFLNVQSHSRSLLAEAERHANQLSETVKSGTRYDMLLNQRESIHQIIDTIGRQEHIRDVRVLNKVGEIIYSSREGEIGRMVDKKAESCYACHAANQPLERLTIKERTRVFQPEGDSPRVLGIINPIYNEPSCWTAACHAHGPEQTVLGVLDVTVSLEEIDRQIRKNKIGIAVFAVSAILFLSLIIGLFVRRLVSVPVKGLLRATDQVGGGNLEYTVETVNRDEMGELARSFNQMTRKLSEARLQLMQSEKLALLGRLAAGIAHEINNPLTGVLTYSSFLLNRAQEYPELAPDLEVIVRETKRSREIVRNMLDFARQSVPQKTAADVHEILQRSIRVLEHQLTKKQIAIVREPDPDLPPATADCNQLQQVFINLLVNAADAIGDDGGTITIATAQRRLPPPEVAQSKVVFCPNRHNLLDDSVKIDGAPAIRLQFEAEGRSGMIYLDSVYGRRRHRFGAAAELQRPLNFTCPACRVSLLRPKVKCPECGSPVYGFEIPGKGTFEKCCRPQCAWEVWRFSNGNTLRDYLEIRISDTGTGISAENINHIFEPFFSTKGQKGTGLGLAVVWGIIDNHHGSIHVESEPGRGSTFIIHLPVEPNHAGAGQGDGRSDAKAEHSAGGGEFKPELSRRG